MWWNDSKIGLQIHWMLDSGEREVEYIPMELLDIEGKEKSGKTFAPYDGNQYEYKVRVSGNGTCTNLIYPKDSDQPPGTVFGSLKITFTNRRRSQIDTIFWKPTKPVPNRGYWIKPNAYYFRVPLDRHLDEPFSITPDERKIRKQREITIRPEQAVFREELMDLYQQCCISGLAIRDALDAAHLIPYNGPITCNPKNGLLLRADLHRLFDADLLGIEPKSKTVCLGGLLKGDPLYGSFENLKIIEPRVQGCSPWPESLEYKWGRFLAKNIDGYALGKRK